MKQEIIQKLFSARWLVTVALAFTFCYMAIIGKVSSEVFVPILIIVLNYYFLRRRNEDNSVNSGT